LLLLSSTTPLIFVSAGFPAIFPEAVKLAAKPGLLGKFAPTNRI